MKKFVMTAVLLAGCTTMATVAVAQMGGMSAPKQAEDKSKRPSPPATATAELKGAKVTVDYGAPSVKGRKIFGGEPVPYDKVWRTGANEATSFVTTGDLMVGTVHVPAGSYTIYSMPSEKTMTLIVNKQTGQWGTKYDEAQDLGRTPMKVAMLPSSQEKMSISFDPAKGGMTTMHVRWDKMDASVMVMAH